MSSPPNEDALRIKRLTYAKYLLRGAIHPLRSSSSLVVAEGLLRLHDSIEIFQSVVLDKIGVPKDKYGSFLDFWTKVKEKADLELPHKARFRGLNDLRNNFKHQALLPNAEEVRDLASVVQPFFEEVCKNIFGVDFAAISLGDLIPEGQIRNRVKAAESLTEAKNYDGATTELAIVMECVFDTMFPNEPHDDRRSNLFGFQPVSYDERLLRSGELGVKAVQAIDDCFDEAQSQIQELRHIVNLLAWGVDLRDYIRFRRIVPAVIRSGSGELQCFPRQMVTLTESDVDFCLQFVINTALKIETRKPPPPTAACP